MYIGCTQALNKNPTYTQVTLDNQKIENCMDQNSKSENGVPKEVPYSLHPCSGNFFDVIDICFINPCFSFG